MNVYITQVTTTLTRQLLVALLLSRHVDHKKSSSTPHTYDIYCRIRKSHKYTMMGYEVPPSPLSPAEQARIRRERRQAKVKSSAGARLNRITSTQGQTFRQEGNRKQNVLVWL